MRLAVLACLSLSSFGQTWGPAPGSQPDYSLIYTGRLFGYFRYPDLQSSSDRGCPDPQSMPLSPQVELFRATLAQARSAKQELVAMGENFAPDLLARAVVNKSAGTPHFGEMVNKDVVSAGADRVLSDNVGCFLRLMNFDATVPGQQDFYYGPERLRQIARFLASPPDGQYKPVQMLAANLVVRSVARNPNQPIGNEMLSPEIRRALQADSPVRFDVPSAVLPWLKQLPVKSIRPDFDVYDCLANPDNPRAFTLPLSRESHCKELRRNGATAMLDALEPGSNHALCAVYSVNNSPETHCQLFSVETPLLQYLPDSPGTTPTPYFVPANGDGAVIFGVLDPSMVEYIGQLSDVWMNIDKRFDTSAQVVDPLEALRQLLGACELDSRCKGRHKVLLAQMPYYKASQLAAKLKAFDLVIAQPDAEHATGDENTRRSGAGDASYLLTPGVAFHAGRSEPLTVNLRRDYFAEGYTEALSGESRLRFRRDVRHRRTLQNMCAHRGSGQGDCATLRLRHEQRV